VSIASPRGFSVPFPYPFTQAVPQEDRGSRLFREVALIFESCRARQPSLALRSRSHTPGPASAGYAIRRAEAMRGRASIRSIAKAGRARQPSQHFVCHSPSFCYGWQARRRRRPPERAVAMRGRASIRSIAKVGRASQAKALPFAHFPRVSRELRLATRSDAPYFAAPRISPEPLPRSSTRVPVSSRAPAGLT